MTYRRSLADVPTRVLLRWKNRAYACHGGDSENLRHGHLSENYGYDPYYDGSGNEISIEAPGPDHLSGLWAEKNGLNVDNSRLLKFPAHWRHHAGHANSCEPWCVRPDCPPDCKLYVGRAAGPIRNKYQMIEGKAEAVAAFHDDIRSSKGTLNMCEIASKAGLPVTVFSCFWRPTAQLF
jgi:hypothetical protein